MVTTLTGRNGRHVRPHVVSVSGLVTGHAPTLCPSSAGSHAKSRAWDYQMKRNIATCDNVEVSKKNCCFRSAISFNIMIEAELFFWSFVKSMLARKWVCCQCVVVKFLLVFLYSEWKLLRLGQMVDMFAFLWAWIHAS